MILLSLPYCIKEINSTMDIKAVLQLNQDEARGNKDICVSVHVPPVSHQGIHADGGETGVMAAIFPNLVDT